MVSIIIGGDVCPIGKNLKYFIKGEAERILNDLYDEFVHADLTIINLEAPLIDDEDPINKVGPTIGVPTDCIHGIREMGINVVNLANNHIMDHGWKGLKNTIAVCKENKITTVGAGKNLTSAQKLRIKNVGSVKVGILGVTENEFSIAKYNYWGANPLNFTRIVRTLCNSRTECDYLMVLLHGGNEYYPYPSPRLKEVCEFFVDMGANAVIVQHTHCPGCIQKYGEAHIVYGQGNFIFDRANRDRTFYEGFLVKLDIHDGQKCEIELLPYVQSLERPGAVKMEPKKSALFLDQINNRSLSIQDDDFVRSKWLNFCQERKTDYLVRIYGHNYLFRKLIRTGIYEKLFLSRKTIQRIQNTILCEAHREIVETLFSNCQYW